MRLLAAVALIVGVSVGCASSDPAPSSSEAYCAVVERTAGAMAGADAAVKRPAMAERRDAAPPEIRADWDTVFDLEPGDPTTRALAQDRIDAFDAEHC